MICVVVKINLVLGSLHVNMVLSLSFTQKWTTCPVSANKKAWEERHSGREVKTNGPVPPSVHGERRPRGMGCIIH